MCPWIMSEVLFPNKRIPLQFQELEDRYWGNKVFGVHLYKSWSFPNEEFFFDYFETFLGRLRRDFHQTLPQTIGVQSWKQTPSEGSASVHKDSFISVRSWEGRSWGLRLLFSVVVQKIHSFVVWSMKVNNPTWCVLSVKRIKESCRNTPSVIIGVKRLLLCTGSFQFIGDVPVCRRVAFIPKHTLSEGRNLRHEKGGMVTRCFLPDVSGPEDLNRVTRFWDFY